MQTLYPKCHTNKGQAGPPSQHANPVAQIKTTWARVGAEPPSRHTNPIPQMPHKQGSEQDHCPDTQTLLPRRRVAQTKTTGQGWEQDHRPDTPAHSLTKQNMCKARVGVGPP